ncbi:hypothetical protein EYC80_004386 [Monilinia laxa]|uniref:Stress-associated endoplasmic reticulum protein n=1 Tax=Monilinia laxa TaxID=61186 RepID=A0A5N6KN01_MONLA|nr:hypothetical protein EYC80_004386 [Monilinia laxa]
MVEQRLFSQIGTTEGLYEQHVAFSKALREGGGEVKKSEDAVNKAAKFVEGTKYGDREEKGDVIYCTFALTDNFLTDIHIINSLSSYIRVIRVRKKTHIDNSLFAIVKMVQTPAQRKANLKFAATNESKQGKSEAQLHKKELKKQKSPISKGWLYLLAFILIGGLVVDVLFRIISYFGGGK